MTSAKTSVRKPTSSVDAAARLEDLIPIAVAVTAGCERCTVRTVQRALERGNPESAVARTLGVVTHVRSLECFAEAVPGEVLARMEGPLCAGGKALADVRTERVRRGCCGEPSGEGRGERGPA